MRVIDPQAWNIESSNYLQELSAQSEDYYTDLECKNTRKLFDLTYQLENEDEMDRIEMHINPLVKLVSLPFVFENPEEHALRGPVDRKVLLMPSGFIENRLSVYPIQLKEDENLFKTLSSLERNFTTRFLLEAIFNQISVEKYDEIEVRIKKTIKKFLHQQILVLK